MPEERQEQEQRERGMRGNKGPLAWNQTVDIAIISLVDLCVSILQLQPPIITYSIFIINRRYVRWISLTMGTGFSPSVVTIHFNAGFMFSFVSGVNDKGLFQVSCSCTSIYNMLCCAAQHTHISFAWIMTFSFWNSPTFQSSLGGDRAGSLTSAIQGQCGRQASSSTTVVAWQVQLKERHWHPY